MRNRVLMMMCLSIHLWVPIWAAEDNDSAVERGLEHMANAQYAEAIVEFQAAKKDFPDVVDLDFMIGFAATKIGNYSLAIHSLRRVVNEEPTMRAKLELGYALMTMGREGIPEARQLFSEVLESSPPPQLAEGLQKLVGQLELAGTLPPSGTGLYGQKPGHSFTGRVVTGLKLDSNPRSSPSNMTVSTIIGDMQLDPSIQGNWDFSHNYQINLAHAYRFRNTPFAWKTDGYLYASFYREAKDLDMTFAQVRTGLAFESQRFGIEALGRFAHYRQDDRTELVSWGFETNAHYFVSKNLPLFAGWRHDVKQRDNTPFRSGTSDSIFLGAMYQPFEHHRFSLFTGMDFERLHVDEESQDQSWFSARYTLLLPRRWEPYVDYRFSHSSYKAKEWFFGKRRKENKHDITVGVKKTFWESSDKLRSLDAEVSYGYTRSRCNIGLYDYKRHQVNCALGFSF